MSWILPDEQSPDIDGLLRDLHGNSALVPSIFLHEVRNALLMAERRGRLKPGEALSSLIELLSLGLNDGGQGDDHNVIALAIKHSLSAYDAAYLALALSRALPLATTHTRLAAGAQKEEVVLRGPIQ